MNGLRKRKKEAIPESAARVAISMNVSPAVFVAWLNYAQNLAIFFNIAERLDGGDEVLASAVQEMQEELADRLVDALKRLPAEGREAVFREIGGVRELWEKKVPAKGLDKLLV